MQEEKGEKLIVFGCLLLLNMPTAIQKVGRQKLEVVRYVLPQEKAKTPISVRITPDQCSVLADSSHTVIPAVIARVRIRDGLHLPAFRERGEPQ
jgi:hypothetical protein